MGLRISLLLAMSAIISGCDYYMVNNYEDRIGYIDPGSAISDPEFQVCFEEVLFPYYYNRKPIAYIHGRDSLTNYFHASYDNQGITNESGYLTLRFVINCKGEIGRFQILETGIDYSEKKFHPSLVEELLNLTKNLKEWTAFSRGDSTFDCFSHITFKIENGELVEILP